LVDVGLIRDAAGRSEYFNNTLGIGFDAAINIRSRKLKYLTGFAMYLTATLQSIALNFDPPHMQVAYDDGALDQRITMLAVGNGPREGGGFLITPDAKVDDGVFDFVFIGGVTQFRMLQLVPKVMNASHVHEPDVKILRTTRLTVDADRALPIHIDGELFAPYEANIRHVEIALIPQAIQVIV
jgi:diacylglycerol kinase family enzyme